jgi:Zn-dependent protease with chaperone function
MHAASLRLPREKNLFRFCFVFSLLIWTLLVISIVGLLYGLVIGFFLLAAHALMLAYIKGHAIKLSEHQLPELYARVRAACKTLGIDQIPEVYVMQAGGMLNAFATKFLGRNFVVVYSDLLEACDERSRELDMILGHELGHLALGHLKWLLFLAPGKILPWFGSAYSRACEYSSDRCGLEVVGDLNTASRGLVVLASGGKYASQVNLNQFVRQAEENSGFWGTIFELNASHPFLPKRVAALANYRQPGAIKVPGRSLLAYPVAPLFGLVTPGGAAAGPLIAVAVIGILAAIAIPQFQQYRALAAQQQMESSLATSLEDFYTAATTYHAEQGSWPCSEQNLDAARVAEVTARGWELRVSCQDNYLALVYPVGQQQHYRVVMFDSGEIEEGVLEE